MEQTNWKIDKSHSEIAFKVKHMMVSTVTGHFEDFDATLTTNSENFDNAKIEFSAKTSSINTKNNFRDTHLKSDDFFNSEKYPEMKFTSKSFLDNKLIGDLTIRDVTKEIVLDVDLNGTAVDSYGQTIVGLEIKGEVNRKEFNLTWNEVTETGSIVVSDKVKLVIDVEFIKQS